MDKKMLYKIVFIFATVLAFTAVRAEDEEKDAYESADGATICNRCNCTNVDGTLEHGESGSLFTLDCSMKGLEKLFANWPEDMGVELVYIMSVNNMKLLQQFPTTDATIFFTCRHCKISAIESHAFIDTPNIVTLDLSYNVIKSSELFPEIFKGPDIDEAYSPIKLESLDLSHNSINYLDKMLFEHTPNLKSLDLSFNPFDQLDEATETALGSLRKIEVLDLSHTGIMELPSSMLEHMGQLNELLLQGNKFLLVPDSIYVVSKSLRYLQLSENPIEVIDSSSFVGLSKLAKLNISALPHLVQIKADSLKHLTSLEVLNCSGNKKLVDFSLENLRRLKSLRELDISNNALVTLDFDAVIESNITTPTEIDKRHEGQFSKLRVLKLAGNPWNCDCAIMHSLSLFDHNATYFKKSFNQDEARCKTPYDLSSKLLYDLPEEYLCAADGKQRKPRIPIYDPPQFLRPKSIMLTVFSVVGVVILGIIIGFIIVCVKRRLKGSDEGYASSPIRYTTVRNSTVSNIVQSPYNNA